MSAKSGSGCAYSTISAAVSAAKAGDVVQVYPGTYKEDVVIGKAISLIGIGRDSTIIDATGLANGIYVDGLDNSGLSGVVVSNLRVENANFEGILLTNVSGVTISKNDVRNNNLALDISSMMCPGIPDFETLEGEDCGEGIHLSAVDHSVFADNIIIKNSGGILISDDTGPTHDNLIIGNTVAENPYDCGITLASHPLAGSNFSSAAGVYHNTITGNTSRHNGFQVPGAGAGVGIFAPLPVSKAYGNVVVNNDITDNGLPGVAMHAHSPGANLSDNMIAANQISGNGADTADTATPGPAGINVSGGDNGSGIPLAVISGIVIAGNTIELETDGITSKTTSSVLATLNSFTRVKTGIDNIDSATGSFVDGRLNWWGCPQGPANSACAGVNGNVLYVPFLTKPFVEGESPRKTW